MQGVRRGINLRARSSALQVQGVRWEGSLRARSSALSVQGVQWCRNMRARSSALSVQGVRWCIILRARSSALSVQGVRRIWNMRARSSALQVQGVPSGETVVVLDQRDLAARHLLPFRPAFMAFAAPAGIDTFTPPPHINCAKSPAAPSADRIISLHLASNAPSRSFSSLL